MSPFQLPHNQESIWERPARSPLDLAQGDWEDIISWLQDNQRALEDWLNNDTGGGSGARSATITIAASNASAPDEWDVQADGTADEATINTEIGNLPAAGGRIVLSEGDFNWAGGASCNLTKANLVVEGQGDATVINVPTGGGFGFLFGTSRVILKNLRIVVTSTGIGVDFQSSTHCRLENVTFSGSGRAVQIGVVSSAAQTLIRHCYFNTTAAENVFISTSTFTRITDCWFASNGGGVNGIEVANGTQVLIEDNHFLGGQYAIFSGSGTADLVLIVGNEIFDYTDGIRIDNPGTGQRYAIIANQIFDCSADGILIGGTVEEVMVHSNRIEDCGSNGIELAAGVATFPVNNCSLQNNVIRGCTGAAILIGAANANTNIAVGNVLGGNGATITDTGTGTITTWAGGGGPGDNL